MDMKGRVALITGGSRGIGRASALAFASAGASVAITYRQDRDAAQRVVAELCHEGPEALAVPLELGDAASIDNAVATVVERWGGIDTLIANAVQWPTERPAGGRFENIDPAEWRRLVDANVIGTAATVRAVLPTMRARTGGRIVLMSSSVGDEGVPGPGPYGVTKSALRGLARTLAWDVGRDGILVNVVNTGFTVTARNLERWPDAMRDAIAARIPSRRLSTPSDVASLVLFLGSPANANMTGEVVSEGSSNGRSSHVAA